MKNINRKLKVKGCLAGIILCMLCLTGCGQDEKIGLDPTDDIAPGLPTVANIENIDGGAIITFVAPKDDDLLCVMASYMINGIERTTKASPYVNKLRVEGFGAVGAYPVKLISVDKSKNQSEPVVITVNPTTPPVESIFKSSKMIPSFGGLKLSWTNATESNIIVEVYKNIDGDWISLENFYSNTKEGVATIRGQMEKSIQIRYRIRDRWDNYSEFETKEIAPIPEFKIDKKKFKTVNALPGDTPYLGSLDPSKLWDDETTGANSSFAHGGDACNNMGRTITFDMGQRAKISRFKAYQRTNDQTWIYTHNNMKRYVLYGCNEITAEMYKGGVMGDDGFMLPTFEGWTKIMDVECYRPSGGTSGTDKVTNEDKEYILGGDEHEVPIETPAFRYVRILLLENWTGGTIFQFAEFTFWGQAVDVNE